MSSGPGWDTLFEKCKIDLVDEDENRKWETVFKEIYQNHIRFGKKTILMFEVDTDVAIKIASKLYQLVDKTSLFHADFPLPLSLDDLSKNSLNPVVTHCENENGVGTRLIACSKRVFKQREQIILSNLGLEENARNSFAGFEEVYGVRCGMFQAYDCIVIRPDKKRLEIQIDSSRPLTAFDVKKIAVHYKKILNEWMFEQFGLENCLDVAINFFPMIEKLYKAPDGKVSRLGHATGTKSIKDERMHSREQDLRAELFHIGGLKEIKTTEAYAITKRWNSLTDEKSLPSLTIPGHFSLLGVTNARIDHVIIDDCAIQEDFDMVLGKLF